MWIIRTDADPSRIAADPEQFRGLLLPAQLLHPATIAVVDKEGGPGKITQPLYTHTYADLRAVRIVHDGVSVRWTVPALAGGIVRIPSTPLLDPFIALNSLAWRMGGADDTYLPPLRPSKKHADQRQSKGKARRSADSDVLDTVTTTLDTAWGPRQTKGWCEDVALKDRGPRHHRAATQRSGSRHPCSGPLTGSEETKCACKGGGQGE